MLLIVFPMYDKPQSQSRFNSLASLLMKAFFKMLPILSRVIWQVVLAVLAKYGQVVDGKSRLYMLQLGLYMSSQKF